MIQTKKVIWKINQKLSNDQYQPITFSHNYQILALGEYETIYLWDMKRRKVILENCNSPTMINYSHHVAVVGNINIWNIKNKQLILAKQNEKYSHISSFSPDLKYIASCDASSECIVVSNLISLVEIRTNRWRNQCGHKIWITAILFSPSGKYIASGLERGALSLYQLIEKKVNTPKPTTRNQSKSECFEILPIKDWNQSKIFDSYERNKIMSLKFSTNESYLISGNGEGTIKFHDFKDHTKVQQKSNYDWLAFSPKGGILAFGNSKNEKVFLWDMEQGKLLTELTQKAADQEEDYLKSIAFSFDEQLLAYRYNYKITLWNLKTRKLISEIKHEDYVQEAVFSPIELALASYCKYDHRIFIWSIIIKKQVTVKQKKVISTNNETDKIVYSPCGNLLAQTGGGNVYLWDIKSEQASKIFEINDTNNYYVNIAFSPAGEVLVLGGRNSIFFKYIKQRKKRPSISARTNDIKFSPNGQLLASSIRDSTTIQIWDTSRLSITEVPIVLQGHSYEEGSWIFHKMVPLGQEGILVFSFI